MFERFRQAFRPDVLPAPEPEDELALALGGLSFNNGLYRVVSQQVGTAWAERLSEAFPAYGGVEIFGYDWLGRAFGLDRQRRVGGLPGVLMFELGTGEVLEVPCNLTTFHDEELVDDPDPALADKFHADWLRSGGTPPLYDQCAGYRKPLFLGGVDGVENLEISDIDVYWGLMGGLAGSVGLT